MEIPVNIEMVGVIAAAVGLGGQGVWNLNNPG